MTDKPMKKYRKPRCPDDEHEWDDPESGESYCVYCGVDERDYDDILALEAEVKRLRAEPLAAARAALARKGRAN